MQIRLSNSQAGFSRTVKQEQEEISRNYVQAFIPGSVEVARGSQEAGFVRPLRPILNC